VGVATLGLALGAAGCSLLFNVDGYEGSPTSHADGNAGDAGDGATPDSCPGFCDDFDDRSSPNVQGAWTAFQPPATGIAEITGAQYKSPPHSAHFSLPRQSTGTNVATLGLTQSLPPSHAFAVDFDFTVTYTPSEFAMYSFANTFNVAAGTDYAGAVGLGDTADGSYAYFPFEPDGGMAATQTTHNLGVIQSAPGSWRHLHFEETFDSSSGRVYLALDGTTSFEDTGVDTLPASNPTTVGFTIGVGATGQTSAVDLYVDNVQIQPMP
jgi:hypothetical protein